LQQTRADEQTTLLNSPFKGAWIETAASIAYAIGDEDVLSYSPLYS